MTAAAVPDPQEGSRARIVETVVLNGQNVTVAEVPDLPERGLTSLTYDYRQSIQVRSFDDLNGRVLLHELLHALLRTDPQQVCPAADDRHEQFVRMLTAGLHDALGYRRAAVPDPRFRDQLAEALWRTICPSGPPLDKASPVSREAYPRWIDALMPTIAAEVEARVQAAANQRAAEELLDAARDWQDIAQDPTSAEWLPEVRWLRARADVLDSPDHGKA
jgi:hypothetical protein